MELPVQMAVLEASEVYITINSQHTVKSRTHSRLTSPDTAAILVGVAAIAIVDTRITTRHTTMDKWV